MVEYSWTLTERKIKCQVCKVEIVSTNRMQKYCKECAAQKRIENDQKQINRRFKKAGVML
jgi:late competence protein required for DNA uptake (superfamily II DNA/RNA helicase)